MVLKFFGWQNQDDSLLEQKEQQDYKAAVASSAIELGEDYLLFPKTVLLPVTARGNSVPGMAERPWTHLAAEEFFQTNSPVVYSVSVNRVPPDAMKSSLRSKRTFMEGALMAAADKMGRRPSMAERAVDSALDAAESQLTLGKPIYKVTLLSALFAHRSRFEEVETARRTIEASLKTKGLIPQRLYYIVERALHYLQPGGNLFPDLDKPTLFPEEVVPLLPKPARKIMPVQDSVWVGMHLRDGRDVHFSFTAGLDPTAPAPPHAVTLILGEMGSGKTTFMRWILLQRLLQGRTILSIDPEAENNKLCQAVGGRVVPAHIPEDPETCLIHPLQGQTPEEMLLAANFLIAALMNFTVVPPGIRAVLHEAVKKRWDRRPTEKMMVSELIDVLGTVPSPDALVVISALRPYMRGSIYEGYFDRPKALLDIDFEQGQWWNFDLSTLKQENRDVVFAVMSWFMYHTVTVGKKPMDICIDEGWKLLRAGLFADLLDELGRRARKRGVGILLITHLPQDLFNSPTSMTMASTAFVGRMSRDEAYKFFSHMGVPDQEASVNAQIVSRLQSRVFLAAPSGGRGALYPVLVTVPPKWLEYWNMIGASTDGRAKLNA